MDVLLGRGPRVDWSQRTLATLLYSLIFQNRDEVWSLNLRFYMYAQIVRLPRDSRGDGSRSKTTEFGLQRSVSFLIGLTVGFHRAHSFMPISAIFVFSTHLLLSLAVLTHFCRAAKLLRDVDDVFSFLAYKRKVQRKGLEGLIDRKKNVCTSFQSCLTPNYVQPPTTPAPTATRPAVARNPRVLPSAAVAVKARPGPAAAPPPPA